MLYLCKILITKACLQVTHSKDIAQEHPLRLAAEGYLMNVLIKYPDPAVEDGIDYGTIKVAQEALKIVILENKGKYKVGYKFNLNTQLIRELFTITPLEGELQPKGQLKVSEAYILRMHHSFSIRRVLNRLLKFSGWVD